MDESNVTGETEPHFKLQKRPSSGGRKHRGYCTAGPSRVINRKHSVRNPNFKKDHVYPKPKVKPKPPVLARWNMDANIQEGYRSNVAMKPVSGVKSFVKHLEANNISNDNRIGTSNILGVKPVLAPKPWSPVKPEMKLVKPSDRRSDGNRDIEIVQSDNVRNSSLVLNTNSVLAERKQSSPEPMSQKPKPSPKPRKSTQISSVYSETDTNSTSTDVHRLSSTFNVQKPPVSAKPAVIAKQKLSNTKSAPAYKNTDSSENIEADVRNIDAYPRTSKDVPNKLTKTFLRNFENSVDCDNKNLDKPFQRESEQNRNSASVQRIKNHVEELEQEDSDDAYDDVEQVIKNIGKTEDTESDEGWTDIQSEDQPQAPFKDFKPIPSIRRRSSHRHSDKCASSRKVQPKERFISDPDTMRRSQDTYQDVELQPTSSHTKDDIDWQTESSDDDGYEEIEPSDSLQDLPDTSNNTHLPVAKTVSSSGFKNLKKRVKHKMEKTVDKAKTRFFSNSRLKDVNGTRISSETDMAKTGISSIPEKGLAIPGHFTHKNLASAKSEPSLFKGKNENMKHQLHSPHLLRNPPSYAPPLPPRDMDDENEAPPPVPPRITSFESNHDQTSRYSRSKSMDVEFHRNQLERQFKSLDIQEQDVRPLSYRGPVSRRSKREDIYVDTEINTHPVKDFYLTKTNSSSTSYVRTATASSTDSESYVDWGEIESAPVFVGGMEEMRDRSGTNVSSGSDDAYLDFSEDIELEQRLGRKNRFKSRFMKDEPLYQAYTKDVIARDSWQRRALEASSSVEDDEDMYQVWELSRSVTDEEEIYQDTEIIPQQANSLNASPPAKVFHQEFTNKTATGMRTLWCEMPEVMESGILEHLTANEKKLQEAMFELITSEASYLKSLNILVDNFMLSAEFSAEHSQRCVLDRRNKHFLFSNILSVRETSERFLTDLEERWQSSENFVIKDVCDIIVKHVSEHFEVFITYCTNQIYQDRTLKELMKNLEFEEARMRLERYPECCGLNMTSFLLLPMQRITRLPLLVDAICHRLDPEQQQKRSQLAVKAQTMLTKIVKKCNEGAKKMEQTEEMCRINNQLVFKDPVKRIPLISSTRHLVKRGELTRIVSDASGKLLFSKPKASKQMLYLFLFTDFLLIAKKKSDEVYSVLDHAQRSSVLVEPINDAANDPRLPFGVPSKCEHLFFMVLLENHDGKNMEFVFSCDSPSDRARWMEAVTPPLQENPDEKIYEVWDCPQVQVIHPYTAQQPDELTLEESDVINVLRKIPDGWFEGENIRDGTKGWFPSSHIEEIKSTHTRARNLKQRWKILSNMAFLHSQTVKMPLKKGKRKSSLF